MTKEERADPIPWADIKRDYDTRREEPVPALCERHGVTPSMLYDRARREGWTWRTARTKQGSTKLLARLRVLARGKIKRIEKRASGIEDDAAEAEMIARMAMLLKLIERIAILEQKEKSVEPPVSPRVIDGERRLELARRIEGLRRQLELEGAVVKPDSG